MLTYKQKHEQANREAIATDVGLVVTIVVWIVCGFGLAGLDVQVFHTPIWVVGGTVGEEVLRGFRFGRRIGRSAGRGRQ